MSDRYVVKVVNAFMDDVRILRRFKGKTRALAWAAEYLEYADDTTMVCIRKLPS